MYKDILVIDDNPDIRFLICNILKEQNFNVRSAANFDQAVLEINKKLPDLAIVDLKTKRNTLLDSEQLKIMNKIGYNNIEVRNPAGTISKALWKAIESSLSEEKSSKITVKGEEDLAALAVISMAPEEAKVIYGMPDRGMVVVDVNQQSKKRANDFLKRMLV